MSDASWTDIPQVPRRPSAVAEAQTVPLPKPEPFGAPVLIGDVATPLAGETLFSLLWKRMAKAQDPEDEAWDPDG